MLDCISNYYTSCSTNRIGDIRHMNLVSNYISTADSGDITIFREDGLEIVISKESYEENKSKINI